ncbi:MAG: hypothetical protein ACFCUJ_12925 [Thiotrichales bacterium]
MMLHFWVFSYNRGRFLRNCVSSIHYCAPHSRISIFDDNSDDPETLEVLAQLSQLCDIAYPPVSSSAARHKHGRLYVNMQSAYELMSSEETYCFLQDDMQLVRPIDKRELEDIVGHYAKNANAGFIHPAFLKRAGRKLDTHGVRFNPDLGGYTSDNTSRSVGVYYADVHIANVHRLREASWQFLNHEHSNEAAARKIFSRMLYLKNPFCAWLPNVPAYRGKRQTYALRFAMRQSRVGFFPIRFLNHAENLSFTNRNASDLPQAERYLSLSDTGIEIAWTYHPLQGKRLLKWAHGAELHVRRLISGLSNRANK